MVEALPLKNPTKVSPQFDLVVRMSETLEIRDAGLIKKEEDLIKFCSVMGGKCTNFEVILYFQRFLNNLGRRTPFMILNSTFLHDPQITMIFAKGFITQKENSRLVFEKIFKSPNYSEYIRKFIRHHFDESGKSNCQLTSDKIWELIEFVFKKYDIEMVKEPTIRDQSGEFVFENVKCVMYSNQLNICCFEIEEFSEESLNDWNNAILIPIIMLLNNISRNLYHNTCLSIIKHGNKISLFTGLIWKFLQIAPNYCVDVNDQLDFGTMIGAIIQYSSCFKKAQTFDFIRDKGHSIWDLNPWLSNLGRFQAEVKRQLQVKHYHDKKKEEHLRKSFQSPNL